MKRPRLPMAAALALSCVLLCGQASAASLTGLDLGAAYVNVTNTDAIAKNLRNHTATLNDLAQRFKLGGSCAQVEVFALDSTNYSYPGSAQVGALTAVTAAFKAGGYAVKALEHKAVDKSTGDFFLATRGGLRVLGSVYGNANDVALIWCSLTTAAATPGARLPVPQPVPQMGAVKTTTPAPTPAAKAPVPVQPATQKAALTPASAATPEFFDAKPDSVVQILHSEGYTPKLDPGDAKTDPSITFKVSGNTLYLTFNHCKDGLCERALLDNGYPAPKDETGLTEKISAWNSDYYTQVYRLKDTQGIYLYSSYILIGGYTKANFIAWLDSYLSDYSEFGKKIF